jgi:cell division protein FtsZ
MKGAKGVLINITGGYDMTLFELDEAANEIRREVDPDANIILGSAFDTELEGRLRVSVIAAGVEAGFAKQPVQPAIPETTVRQPIAAPVEDPEPELEAETTEIAAEEDVAEAVEAEAAEPVVDEDRPAIITHRPTAAQVAAEMAEADEEHYEGAEGDEEVTADSVFSARRDTPVADKPKAEQSGSGFANLFGWRRNPQGENDDSVEPAPIVSSPDDHPEPAPFDDADLEIPAFLRRSANH